MLSLKNHHEALVVGTGFSGLISLYLLKQLGLDVVAVEAGSDVGGTWFWNVYPGARSDSESIAYRLSFDKELNRNASWPNNYLLQPELQAYFQEVASKHDLYSHIKFNAILKAATWDDDNKVWKLKINTGEEFTARYVGIERFKGKVLHTSQWHSDIKYEGKRIGVIGSGASGVQIVSGLSEKAGTLTHFIRHAQYVLPARYRPVNKEERNQINENYDKIWDQVFSSAVGFGFEEPPVKTFSVSAEDRERIFQDLWDQGNGSGFYLEAVNFIHKKIRGIVKDSQKADVLTSNDWFARRPLTDDKYYYRFNQDNVFAVDLKRSPIVEVTADGIKTEDGKEHPLDLLVFATGFDSVAGSYYGIDIKGRNGKTFKQHWEEGPKTHKGITTSEFPNLFFINGPGVPFANQPPVIEVAANFTADLIARGEEIRHKGQGTGVIESTPEADEEWLETCRTIAGCTLFSKTNSWFFGENIPGRKPSPMFSFGGIAAWRQAIETTKDQGYTGFDFGLPASSQRVGTAA